jgi:hypothetical protein
MTNYQLAVWLGFIAMSFTLGFYCGKYDEQE